MFASRREKIAAGAVLLLLLFLPAPLLPPHWLAEAVQSLAGVGWKSAWLAAAVGLRFVLYGSIGVLAAFAVRPASTPRGRLLQCVAVPLVVVLLAFVIRSVKLGHLPVLANSVVPMIACFLGASLGLLFWQRGWRSALVAGGIAFAALLWTFFPDVSSGLTRETSVRLRHLVAAGPGLPTGEDRFGALCKAAFAPMPDRVSASKVTEENRAAILALGIAIGHERLARFAGLNRQNPLVREAAALRQGLTLRGRDDWARHFWLSAALMVLENPFISDAGGVVKEELDALARGSGFSFGDLAADRAGVRFALAATDSEAAAKAMQLRLQGDFAVDDYFPPIADLPENLTLEQFRRDFGGMGAQRYRAMVREIDARLDKCAGLTPRESAP